jgi:hypothetical protein
MAEAPNLLAWRDAPRAKRQTKYANVVCEVDGIKFDSMAERQRWLNLQLLVKADQIRDLRRQVEYVLIPAQKRPSGGVERACCYLADFVYVDVKTGRTVVEDVKGAVTPEFRIKRKLMLERHGVEILLT